MMNVELARFNMVEQQIRPWDVLDDRVLNAIITTPREQFVPENAQSVAFTDIEIPIGHDEVMMAPKVEARLLQALSPQEEDVVLEVGTGSGFVTALQHPALDGLRDIQRGLDQAQLIADVHPSHGFRRARTGKALAPAGQLHRPLMQAHEIG